MTPHYDLKQQEKQQWCFGGWAGVGGGSQTFLSYIWGGGSSMFFQWDWGGRQNFCLPHENVTGPHLVINDSSLTSFIQDSADKHIPSKTSRSVSSIPWVTSEIRRKIRRRNKTHAKAKKTGSSKLRSKFETLRREIKAEVRKKHDLYVNNLVGDVKETPETSIGTLIVRKKTPKVFHP